ncbi:MAG: dTMP kinase [Dehalococcoidia bacterium]|nr:dTMP kinase [Dehalococcoidia bacterium]
MPPPHPRPPARGQWTGLFIAFEGGDGSGKSVQAHALCQRLRKLKLPVRLVAEPGGTPLGRYVRALVTGQEGLRLRHQAVVATAASDEQLVAESIQLPPAPVAELFLFAASRAQLVADVIRPSLSRGEIVICDRYAPSSLAYQGYGRGLSKALVGRVNELATDGVWPDAFLLLDAPVEVARARRQSREAGSDRFEREGLEFHRRVRRGYLAIAAHDPDRWTIVPADRPRKDVEGDVWKVAGALLARRYPQLAQLVRGDLAARPVPAPKLDL